MKFLRNRSLAFKQSLAILGVGALVLGIVGCLVAIQVKKIVQTGIERAARYAVRDTAGQLEQQFAVVQQEVETLAGVLESTALSESEQQAMLMRCLKDLRRRNPAVSGAAIAYAPATPEERFPQRMLYVCERQDRWQANRIGGRDYQYMLMPWFLLPRELGRTVWVEPYFDHGAGNVYMTTCAAPIFRTENGVRRFVGVVTGDVALYELRKIVDRLQVSGTGYAVLISNFGTFLSHPDPELISNQSFFSLADSWESSVMRDVGSRMITGGEGSCAFFGPGKDREREKMLYYAPIPATGWSIGVVFSQSDLFGPLHQVMMVFIAVGGVGLLLLAMLVVAVVRRATRPLLLLSEATEAVGAGNLQVRLPDYEPVDEVGRLTRSFGRMQTELGDRMRELAENVAARQKIESELTIAHQIQQEILPELLPPLPECREFSLAALLTPARAVGGDLYDLFFIDEYRFCLIVGDVSGKGVPAALFMAITQTLQRSVAENIRTPGELVSRVNAMLGKHNVSLMFVTYFLGIVDLRNGELAYTNAGHNAPWIMRRDGRLEPLTAQHGAPLALFDEPYGSDTIHLDFHDGIFLYTDGVTEAMDRERQEYGEERLRRVLATAGRDWAPRPLLEKVQADVEHFVAGCEQSDDITILVFRMNERLEAAEGMPRA